MVSDFLTSLQLSTNDPPQKNSLKSHYFPNFPQNEPLTCENLSPKIKKKKNVD